MIIGFLRDRLSWILFVLLFLAGMNGLLWLDPGIGVELFSLLYINALLFISFSLFLIWRYNKETAYIRELAKLAESAGTDWIEALPETRFKQDETVNELLTEVASAYSQQLHTIRQSSIVQGDYTAAWVHEAKAPLTAMKLVIDSNRDHPAMRKVEAEWLRVHLLIDQQLYISRLPTLEQDYALEEAELKEMVMPEVRELMSWCLEKNLAVETDELDKAVITDKKWSRFIFRQILSNAVKYSPEGGTITIAARREPEGHLILSIKDEGPGIAPHDLPRIFDKGFTGSTGRIHNAATGLGLYLAKMVADRIGVTLHVSSVPGAGTTLEMAFSLENEFDHIRK
ncbi:sensor histidine kinase [Planococcus beigongshangi]|uniref:sensor histidine kinase n=1 Tax=Planococcus beigongshangi TaxID=2782536 RepID=UPI00193B5FF3|nr:sensor histidine kinase [Planococcus beigongshangi]